MVKRWLSDMLVAKSLVRNVHRSHKSSVSK